MNPLKTKTYMCDFETTVYEGQTSTEVWASAIVELYTEDVIILHSIEETFRYFYQKKHNCILYYHNLKFDGSFWLWYLLSKTDYRPAITKVDGEYIMASKKELHNKQFIYSISDRGQWYTITIKTPNNTIEIRDSLKLLPFSVRKIGKSFGTKHKKLEMNYEGYRYAGCEITEEERKYIANDVLVVKEALEIMFDQGHKKLTIGSCCLEEFKRGFVKEEYKAIFPDLTEIETYDGCAYSTADEFIRKSYRGGWCYLAKGKENKIFYDGCTADVNSLYPSMMSSESGNLFPVGRPEFFKGALPSFKTILPDGNYYYFIHIKCRFKIKKDKLPFIQIKGSPFYDRNECLETSDIYNKKTGHYCKYYIDLNGNKQPAKVELTLTCTDYKLFLEHYHVYELEIIDGCWFFAERGLFDQYMQKYKKIKMESKGAIRELAKLFLNNLYGKMASNDNSSFKVASIKEDGSLSYYTQVEHDKQAGFIAIGSAITSYARNFTIRAAQKNYYGKDKPGFIYADTDSIHCDLSPEQLKGVPQHQTDFCHWKIESGWDKGIFVRQKTYIEHVTIEDLEPIDEPYYNLKCAGMPEECKKQFIEKLNNNECDLTDFKIGLKIFGKLMPKQIAGGTLLVATTFQLR